MYEAVVPGSQTSIEPTRYTACMAKAAPYLVGRLAGKQFRKAKWMWQSFTGNEDEAIQAEHAVGRDMATVVKEQAREQGTSDPEFQVLLDDIANNLVGDII